MAQQMTAPGPEAARAAARELVTALAGAWGENLEAAALYGSLVGGGYTPGQSDVNLLLVVRDASPAALAPGGNLLRAAAAQLRAVPFILTRAELHASADVFPIKFLLMRHHHEPLSGPDVLAELEVTEANLRLRCEQELRNGLLRFRHRLLLDPPHPANQGRLLRRAAQAYRGDLAVLLYLRTSAMPSADELPRLAGEALGLDLVTLFEELAVLQDGEAPPEESAWGLVERFTAAQAAACEQVDRL